MIPSEIEFIAISMQMSLGYMMESTMNTPLQKGKIRLNRICRSITSGKLTIIMFHYFMTTLKILADATIRSPFIGHNAGVLVDHFLYSALDGCCIYSFNRLGINVSLPFYQGKNWCFVSPPTTLGLLLGLLCTTLVFFGIILLTNPRA